MAGTLIFLILTDYLKVMLVFSIFFITHVESLFNRNFYVKTQIFRYLCYDTDFRLSLFDYYK
jgi:hypothetical protein